VPTTTNRACKNSSRNPEKLTDLFCEFYNLEKLVKNKIREAILERNKNQFKFLK